MRNKFAAIVLGLIVPLFFSFPTSSAPSEVTPLRVGITADFPPMVYKEAGKVTGVEVDFANALGAELNRPVKFVEVDWADQITALAEGRTDIIMSGMSITPARQL